MIFKMFRTVLIAVAITVTFAEASQKKVLVYMLDGMRADMIETVNAPVWQALKENRWAESYKAAWSVDACNEPFLTTSSAPNHTAIATGLLLKDHKVSNNKTFDNYDPEAAPTFLQRLHLLKGASTAFAFSWMPDKVLIPESPARIIPFDDVKNNAVLVKMMKGDDAPDATLVFDDAPDHGAHSTGFYPFGEGYFASSQAAMERIGMLLDAIKGRRQFKDEDWLIVICSDHGGYHKSHGMSGGQASTVPLLFCSKSMPAGRLFGCPGNLAIVPAILEHFGITDEARKMPGYTEFKIAREQQPDIANGLLYDLQGKDGSIVNSAPAAKSFTVHGSIPVNGRTFDLGDGGHITLDSLKGFAADGFSFAFSIELNPDDIIEDPPLFSNKDWKNGKNDGFCAFLKNKGFMINFATEKLPVTYLANIPGRLDLQQFDFIPDHKTIIAVSIGRDGLVTLFQKTADGNCYWFSVAHNGFICKTDLDWNIGQDGTGLYGHKCVGKVSSFKFWNRPLTHEELLLLE